MNKIIAYIKILRPANAVMTASAVFLGFWISGGNVEPGVSFLLMISAITALGFGNVINDIHDVKSDRINHPSRPIPKGDISVHAAITWACVLVCIALVSSALISPSHLAGCLIPIFLLWIYALRLKGTPFAGNILVSLCVAYALLYGGLNTPYFFHLIMPTACAFLLNLSREIIKDIEDSEGDRKHGVMTTAVISPVIIRICISVIAIFYIVCIATPYLLSYFHKVYLLVCIIGLIPIHAAWLLIFFFSSSKKAPAIVSAMIKLEMLGGLIAITVDRLFTAAH